MNKAVVIADSIGPCGRVTSLILEYPRMVHADMLRHRGNSHAVGSTRAVPSGKMRARLRENPASISWWGRNQPGMVAKAQLEGQQLARVQKMWESGLDFSLRLSQRLEEEGLHKQLASRVLEPYANVVDLVTATEWENFDALRCHPDAQPEIQAIAQMARDARAASIPRRLEAGEWHRPFIKDDDARAFWRMAVTNTPGTDIETIDLGGGTMVDLSLEDFLNRISVARIARTSYLNHDGAIDYKKDLGLYDLLISSHPGHWSPLEHVCRAMRRPGWRARMALWIASLVAGDDCGDRFAVHGERFLIQSGNFAGWQQLRKTFANEHVGGPRV